MTFEQFMYDIMVIEHPLFYGIFLEFFPVEKKVSLSKKSTLPNSTKTYTKKEVFCSSMSVGFQYFMNAMSFSTLVHMNIFLQTYFIIS